MADNMETFVDLYEHIKQAECIEDVIQEWSGANISIPAFVGEIRDKKIYEEYRTLKNMGESRKYLVLSRQFNLGTRKIQEVIRLYRGEVGLFENKEEE